MLASIRNSLFRQAKVAAHPATARYISIPATPSQTNPSRPLGDIAHLTDLISGVPDIDKDKPPGMSTNMHNRLSTLTTRSREYEEMENIQQRRCTSLPSSASCLLTVIPPLLKIIKPSDLTPAKCLNERRGPRRAVVAPPTPEARYKDIFRQLNLDPVDFALNPSVLSAYVSEMGKIYGRNITGLTSRSQRRLGKAIRRARMIGILPQLSRPSKSWAPTFYRLRK